ncbi:flavodoxin-dependent (E)-4-hydroxy-3-methylbut-2-enyl-diphosphate synthase [Candidatus Curtissbacteria bacterium]|nr:flavodoxin-dependent (E)-4-hydroxy-3-methylbut-2-enyl-diphosphate synthase [Candidatus Curtissbacteria bacterium]
MYKREQTRPVKIGKVTIGGGNLVRVQSMTQTRTHDVDATVKQIHELEEAGCEIIRVTVPDMESAKAIKSIKKQIRIPLVADIHFQYLLAIEAAKQGVDKVRINPGNIGGVDRVKEVVKVCRAKNIPMRIGVNMGSLERDLYAKYGGFGVPRVMVESATRHIKILESLKFYNIVVSLKGDNPVIAREAYILFAKRYNYPLHVGITEAGTLWAGSIKSAVGIGSILAEGIGDTIRVSIADDPREQVKVGWEILKSAGLRQKGVEVIACPTCGRTEINLIELAKKVEAVVSPLDAPIKVAVMGCVVNGPGEASFADIGVCGGKGQGAIFKKGKLVKTLKEEDLLPEFIDEIKKVLVEKGYRGEIKKLQYG